MAASLIAITLLIVQPFALVLSKPETRTDIETDPQPLQDENIPSTKVDFSNAVDISGPADEKKITDEGPEPLRVQNRDRSEESLVMNTTTASLLPEVKKTRVCPSMKFGSDCSETCGRCYKDDCDEVSGVCLSGCLGFFQGDHCKTCIAMKYGPNCKQDCGHCNDDKCDPVNGACFWGCTTGYQGDLCKDSKPTSEAVTKSILSIDKRKGQFQVCPTMKYGLECSEACGRCKKNDCDPLTGICRSGCEDFYQGDQCKICIPMKYGEDCKMDCGHCIQNACDHTQGACTWGCNAGYQGELCTEVLDANQTTNLTDLHPPEIMTNDTDDGSKKEIDLLMKSSAVLAGDDKSGPVVNAYVIIAAFLACSAGLVVGIVLAKYVKNANTPPDVLPPPVVIDNLQPGIMNQAISAKKEIRVIESSSEESEDEESDEEDKDNDIP